LTPVVLTTVGRLGVRARPHLYACGHLSNTASLLLPVSNLTNLLAFSSSGVSFLRFSGLMALPWLAAVGTEYLVFRRFFAADLFDTAAGQADATEHRDTPWFPLLTVAATLAGFVVTSLVGVNPAWAAAAGALVLALRAAVRGRIVIAEVVRASDLPFLVFVLAMGLVVRAVVDNGLNKSLREWIPAHFGLIGLLGIAAVAAVLANVINNLPAVLVLLPLTGGPAAVLAVLIGVNLGPNLTLVGSLATMLWRRIVRQHNHTAEVAEFTKLGLLTAPATVVAAVVALWVSLRVLGT
ncbi:MAG: arsenic transporter, partial [Mycobacteriaceae bacterium]|nr:arsenic transporter [Mycobacteriaceae bacterium]